MAQIYNTDLSKELIKGASIQVNRDLVPSQLAEKVVPVMEVNPNLLRKANIYVGTGSAASGTSTVYTTPTNKDFYLIGISMALIKDATCDTATGKVTINGTPDGLAQLELIGIPIITLTAQSASISRDFIMPILLKRNTTINSTQTYTAGLSSRTFSIIGYVVENQIQ
jgi:hypothetical protein